MISLYGDDLDAVEMNAKDGDGIGILDAWNLIKVLLKLNF